MQRERLAAAIASEHGEEFAATHGERQVVHQHASAGEDRHGVGSQRWFERVDGETPPPDRVLF